MTTTQTISREQLITSEIADFFADFVEVHTYLGGPNTVEEAQTQLTERVLTALAGMSSEPVGYRYRFVSNSGHSSEWRLVDNISLTNPAPNYEVQPVYAYAAPPASAVKCSACRGSGRMHEPGEEPGDCSLCNGTGRLAAPPAPVAVPDGYALVPLKPTKDMLTAAEDERGADWQYAVDIWDSMCRAAMLKADGTLIGEGTMQAEPVTADNTFPGWIKCSEMMPENKPGCFEYIVFDSLNNRAHHDYWNVPEPGDDAFTPFWNHYGQYVTHWMPLPAAPEQEV